MHSLHEEIALKTLKKKPAEGYRYHNRIKSRLLLIYLLINYNLLLMSIKQPLTKTYGQQDGATDYLQDDPYQMNSDPAAAKHPILSVHNSTEDVMHQKDQTPKVKADKI